MLRLSKFLIPYISVMKVILSLFCLSRTWKDLVLSVPEILLMSSLLCSTDVIAAISMVKYEE